MGVFEIDDPDIDVEELEKKVRAAIEARRGVRFTDKELSELRAATLEPRMRRDDSMNTSPTTKCGRPNRRIGSSAGFLNMR